MHTYSSGFHFVAAALTTCILTVSVSRVSHAVPDPADCDGTKIGKPKLCLGTTDGGLGCEGRGVNACDGIGIYNVKTFSIDTVASSSTCKTSLAVAKSEACAEQYYCEWDVFESGSSGISVA